MPLIYFKNSETGSLSLAYSSVLELVIYIGWLQTHRDAPVSASYVVFFFFLDCVSVCPQRPEVSGSPGAGGTGTVGYLTCCRDPLSHLQPESQVFKDLNIHDFAN